MYNNCVVHLEYGQGLFSFENNNLLFNSENISIT